MPEQARYYIDVTLTDVDQVEQLLTHAGVKFCPIENMVHIPRENMLETIFTGTDGQYLLEAINTHLEEEDLPERLPTEFHEMPPAARRDLLELATLHISWHSDFAPTPIELSMTQLQKFLDNHPHN